MECFYETLYQVGSLIYTVRIVSLYNIKWIQTATLFILLVSYNIALRGKQSATAEDALSAFARLPIGGLKLQVAI